jgi:thiol:disulfide interchange protein
MKIQKLLIVFGVIAVAVGLLLLKGKPTPAEPLSSSALPEAQLDRALEAGKPVLAFFHSNSCEQCLIMIDTVKQVFPEFVSSVALIDVNVYDDQNAALLRRVRLQYIPMLVFYDRNGNSKPHIGVLEPAALRARLAELSGAD